MTDGRAASPPVRVVGRAIVAYVIGVFLAAALGAPWLYGVVHAAADDIALLVPLTAHPLHRYLQRLLLVFALGALPLLLRVLGLRRWQDVGLGRPRAHGRVLMSGVLLGAGTILVAAALPVIAGARVFDPLATPGRVASRVLTALVVAPCVALLEELLFRGVLDGSLRRAHASAGALAASSAFYAAVHFLAHPAAPASLTWSAGFTALGGMLAGLTHVGALVPAFLTLWLVGTYLGGLYQRTGTLFANIGVHAGGIFVLQLYGLVTTEAAGANAHLWGSGRLVDGWVALGVLLAAGGVARAVRVRACRTRLCRTPLAVTDADPGVEHAATPVAA